MTDTTDRRQFWRAAFHSPVRLADRSGTTSAALVDISLKGALVEVSGPWPGALDEPCRLTLHLGEDAAIDMNAVVAHVAGRRVGLRCESIDLDSITHLRRLVELNAGDPALLDRELAALLGN